MDCQLLANVMIKLYYSLVFSHLTYAFLAWGRSGSTNAAKIESMQITSAEYCWRPLLSFTWEHANYLKIITKRSPLFTQFIITLLYWKLWTQIPLISINISKTNYFLINHLICRTPDRTNSNFNTPLYNHQKLKNLICTK